MLHVGPYFHHLISKGKQDSVIQHSNTNLNYVEYLTCEKAEHFIHNYSLIWLLLSLENTQSKACGSLLRNKKHALHQPHVCTSTCILCNHTEFLSFSNESDPICCTE